MFRFSANQSPYFKARIFWLISILIFSYCSASAHSTQEAMPQTREEREKAIRVLEEELAKGCSVDDSISILYDIFDLSDGNGTTVPVAIRLAETAARNQNYSIALDAYRNAANISMRNDSVVSSILEKVKALPQSEERDMSEAFIKVIHNISLARYTDDKQRNKRQQELVREYNRTPPTSLYDRIVQLHAICVNLSVITEGELLVYYVRKLGRLINELPQKDVPLRNMYYVWASMLFTQARYHQEALATTTLLLNEIDKLDKRNEDIGRRYASYDATRYICYTRILENYEALSPADVDQYYALAMKMTESSPRAASTYAMAPLPSIYYNFYKKKYQQAFKLIQECKDSPYLKPKQLQVLKMYIEAATAIGNRDALLQTYPTYTHLLEEKLDKDQRERMRELQELYEINDVKMENIRLLRNEQEAHRHMWEAIAIMGFALLVALLIFYILLLRKNRRRKMVAKQLEESNTALRHERESLVKATDALSKARDEAQKADRLKTDFINNMNHEVKVPLQAINEYSQLIIDNIDDQRKKYLSTFGERLLLNCDMVNTIVNDVLQLSELHNSSLNVKENHYESIPICETAIGAIHRRVRHGVPVSISKNAQNFIFTTDRHRLIQILTNLLTNAAKFTAEGSIVLDCHRSDDGTKAIFTVTDTGIGIPYESRETIFERFIKLDNTVPGAGIGLTIARMLARLMGGDLTLDTTYTSGARFILTLPVNGTEETTSDK